MSKRGIAPEAIDVLSRGDEQLHRMADSHAEQTECARRSSSDERLQLRVEVGDLLVQLSDTPGDASQRNLRGFHGFLTSVAARGKTGSHRAHAIVAPERCKPGQYEISEKNS